MRVAPCVAPVSMPAAQSQYAMSPRLAKWHSCGGSDFHSPAPASIVFTNEHQRRIRFLPAHGNGQIRSQLHGGGLGRMGRIRSHQISQNPGTQKVCMAPHEAQASYSRLKRQPWTKKCVFCISPICTHFPSFS